MRLIYVAFSLAIPQLARAERPERGLTASLEGSVGYLPRAPELTDVSTSRSSSFPGLGDRNLQPLRPATLVGLGMHFGYTPERVPLFTFPFLGVRLAYPAARAERFDVVDSTTSQHAALRLGNVYQLEIMLPGAGVSRHFGEHWKAAFLVQPELSIFHAAGTLTQGVLSADLGATGFGVGVTSDLSVCGRLRDNRPLMVTWLCPFVSPVLASSNPERVLPALLVGLRLEFNRHDPH